MTELELKVFLMACDKEELVDLLADVFADQEYKIQEIEQMQRKIEMMKCRENCMHGFEEKSKHRRCDPCSEWELKEDTGVSTRILWDWATVCVC